jgi:hypothetical protein
MSKPQVKKAEFYAAPRKTGAQPLVTVHFNPASLQHTITNTLEENRSDHKQYVTKSSAKLTMDLIFDTTDKSEDVRKTTKKVADFMKTDEKQKKRVPPIVVFEWGVFSFQGLVESYKETIDFFSSEGVPLRATINLTLSRQEKVFEESSGGGAGGGGGGGADGSAPGEDAVDVQSGGDQSATDMAADAGDPGAGRDIAAANGEESMRFPSGPMTVDPSVQLGPPVAFASGGAGLSAGAGIGAGIGLGAGAGGLSAGGGFGISGGLGVSGGAGLGLSGGLGASGAASFGASGGAGFGASADISISGGASIGAGAGLGVGAVGASGSFGISAGVSASASAGLSMNGSAGFSASFGGSASAGVTASAGAFAGLRSQARSRHTSTIDTERLIKQSDSVSVATDSGAKFRLGGRASFEESTSLSADFRGSANLRSRIRFEES